MVRRTQAGKSWFHGENHFVAFLIRRCMDVVRGLSRRLRSRDWLVLIHDGSSGSRSSGILCFCFIDETLETRGAAARRGASRGGRAGRSYTAAIAHGGGTVEREPESAGARSNLHRRQSLTIRADFTCISSDLSSPHLLMRTGHVPPWNNPCLEIGRPCNRSSSSTPHKAVPHLRMDPS